MTRAFTTKVHKRPANLYASMPPVAEKEPTQDEIDRNLRAAQRSLARQIERQAKEEARITRNHCLMTWGTIVIVTATAIVLILA